MFPRRVVKYCPFATVFVIPTLEHSLITCRWSGRFANLFTEKLSHCFPKIILYKSQIRVVLFSEMNCCSKSGIHEHSPNSQIHIQIFHRTACLCSMDLPDHGGDGFHIMGCVWRYLEMMFPRRFRILLTFLINWRTGSLCDGFLPSFIVLGSQSLLNLLLLDATGLPAALPSTRLGMHPWVALETSALRRMSLVQHSSCLRVTPNLSASPDF